MVAGGLKLRERENLKKKKKSKSEKLIIKNSSTKKSK